MYRRWQALSQSGSDPERCESIKARLMEEHGMMPDGSFIKAAPPKDEAQVVSPAPGAIFEGGVHESRALNMGRILRQVEVAHDDPESDDDPIEKE